MVLDVYFGGHLNYSGCESELRVYSFESPSLALWYHKSLQNTQRQAQEAFLWLFPQIYVCFIVLENIMSLREKVGIFWTEQLKGSWDLISQRELPRISVAAVLQASEEAVLSCCSSIKSSKHLAWRHRRILWQKQR